MEPLKKLLNAKLLILEAEKEFIDKGQICPYEIAYTLQKLDDAIETIKKINE